MQGCGEIRSDLKEGLRLTREASDRGDALGQSNLGTAYANGLGVTRDYAEAMKWYRKSADQGAPDGQFNVGLMYLQGEGVARDVDEAKRWFTLAARQGHEKAIAGMQSLGAEVPAEAQTALLRQAAMGATAADLAQGYAFTLMMGKMLQLVESGATLDIGGQTIDKSSVGQAKELSAMKEAAYGAAIRERRLNARRDAAERVHPERSAAARRCTRSALC